MIKVSNKNLSIEQICNSGQCFRLNKTEENRYALVAMGKYLEIEQKCDEAVFLCTQDEYDMIWSEYFDMNTDYDQFIRAVTDTDKYLYETVQFGKGIRILKQDIWETLISFIISQRNNIKRIKKCVELLCRRFGEERYSAEGKIYYTFPSVQALADASEEDLRNCNLGYRSRYVLSTANSILHNDVNLDVLEKMDYAAAKSELQKLCGVGSKVADCVCLFALHYLEAFPVDTHIEKVLERNYPQGFPFRTFPGYAGVIQQYIFYYDLMFAAE